MKTIYLSLVASVVTLSISGCTSGPGYGASLQPGAVVTNPTSQPTGIGTGYLSVVWAPAQAGLNGQANWWINAASPRPISTTGCAMAAGNTTVTFGPLTGYTPPAPVPVHIWKGQTTTVTVTYGQP